MKMSNKYIAVAAIAYICREILRFDLKAKTEQETAGKHALMGNIAL
jgi:hypothetical protein